MQQKGILYHVSLPQYYDYCIPLYLYYYLLYLLFIVFILAFIKHHWFSCFCINRTFFIGAACYKPHILQCLINNTV